MRLREVGTTKFGCRSMQKEPKAAEVKVPWICLVDAVYQHLVHKSAELKPCHMGSRCYIDHNYPRAGDGDHERWGCPMGKD
jgi:hypothetical protein